MGLVCYIGFMKLIKPMNDELLDIGGGGIPVIPGFFFWVSIYPLCIEYGPVKGYLGYLIWHFLLLIPRSLALEIHIKSGVFHYEPAWSSHKHIGFHECIGH